MLYATLLLSAGCDSGGTLPQKASVEYDKVVASFYSGLAALQVGDDVHAETRLADVTRLAPGEPAGWANWGVLALRQRNFDVAAQRLERARKLAPQDAHIHNLLGILASSRGDSARAIAELRQAAELDPQDLRTAFALAQEIERQGDARSDGEFQQAMQKIVAAQPDNLAALLELCRIAAKRGDAETLKSAAGKIVERSTAWPPEVQQQVAALQAAAGGGDLPVDGAALPFQLPDGPLHVAELLIPLTAGRHQAGIGQPERRAVNGQDREHGDRLPGGEFTRPADR